MGDSAMEIGRLVSEYYIWLKAIHIIFVICWMAGILYLPRLFVYHSMVEIPSDSDANFRVMERKLLYYIVNPSGIITVLSGGLMMIYVAWSGASYQHIKLTAAGMIIACHIWYIKLYGDFAEGRNKHGHKFYRVLNEIPSVLMVIIVILAVVKPKLW